MISNPKHGWCKFNLGDFIGYPSYTTNIPLDLLNFFIGYFNGETEACWLDEEGGGFTLVVTPYSLFVISEQSNLEEPKLLDFSYINVKCLAKELVNDIKNNMYEWCEFSIYDDDEEEIKLNREKLRTKILTLERLIGE